MRNALVIGIIAASAATFPGQGGARTPPSLAGLPEYCGYVQGVQGGDPAQRALWRQRLGPEFTHLHHYCAGLTHLNRARGSTAKERAKWYSAAVDQFDYVLGHIRFDYVLYPEVATRKGEALVGLKRYGEADTLLLKAAEVKPDYWPAYARLAEGLIARQQTEKARDVLTKGIAKAQDPRALQRMLDDLGKGPRSETAQRQDPGSKSSAPSPGQSGTQSPDDPPKQDNAHTADTAQK